jgi:hypothetical protein
MRPYLGISFFGDGQLATTGNHSLHSDLILGYLELLFFMLMS